MLKELGIIFQYLKLDKMITEKMSIKTIKGKLTIIEMKSVYVGMWTEGSGFSVCCQRASNISCNFYEAGTGQVQGICEENSPGQCVCKTPNSSVVSGKCGSV
jgi:hypothetical protein